MANKKFTDLDPAGANPTLVDSDIMAVTLDPGGTPVSRKTSISNLMGKAPVQSVAGRTGAVTLSNTDIAGLGTAATTASTDYATAAQGATADSAVQPTDGIEVLSNVSISNPADGSILKYVSANSQYEEASLGTAATTDASDYATAAHTHAIDDLSDVDTSTVAPTNDDLLKWDGTNFVPGTVSVDVDTPLNTALRGTVNPHIGAYPNQPFNALENSAKSVMIITNSAGELDFLIPDGGNFFLNSPSGGRVSPSFGFSVSEDANEPDIEVAGTLGGSVETYSVISGDSDTKGANGLPIRQGFNLPDLGAYPAPILISGGTIA
jgi:hypothetical protein